MKPSSGDSPKPSPIRTRSTALKIHEGRSFPERSSRAERLKNVIDCHMNPKSDEEKSKGKDKAVGMETDPKQGFSLTDDELKTLDLLSDKLQHNPSTGFLLPSIPETFDENQSSFANSQGTPLFYSNFNLQSGYLETIGQNPHYAYMEVPPPEITLPEQLTSLASHLQSTVLDVKSTANTLNSHSNHLSTTVGEASEMANRLTHQSMLYENTLNNISVKMDTMCDYVQEKHIRIRVALNAVQEEVSNLQNRVQTIALNQQQISDNIETIVTEMFHTQQLMIRIEGALRTFPGLNIPRTSAPVPQADPPVSAAPAGVPPPNQP